MKRQIHVGNTGHVVVVGAFQHAIAAYLAEKPEVFADLAPFFAAKRALLTGGLGGTPFQVMPAQGSYFTLVDYSRCESLTGLDDMAAAFSARVAKARAKAPLATAPVAP